MTDLARLREALERQQADVLLVSNDLARVIADFDSKDRSTWGEILNDKLTVIDAARAYLDLMENGERGLSPNGELWWYCDGIVEVWPEKPDDCRDPGSFHEHTRCGWVRLVPEETK